MPIPDGVDLVDSAGLPEVACTVWSNLVLTAHLSAGQLLLIHGGAPATALVSTWLNLVFKSAGDFGEGFAEVGG
jgi:NADPH:quinone reductase-like Zn-dependent oxidoreductase